MQYSVYNWYKHTNDEFFDDFPKISEDFPKILEKLPKGQAIISEHFPKISKDCRKITKDSEEELMMFQSQSKTSTCSLKDYVTIAMVIFLVTMATPISSHVKDKKSIFTTCHEDMIF